MVWTPDKISVRILDADEALIRDYVARRFPDIRLIDRASEAEGLRVLLSFRPPEDQPLEAYDWVHALGAGVDHLCKGIEDPSRAPIISRTTGNMGRQMSEYCVGYALADYQKLSARHALQQNAVWDQSIAVPKHLFQARIAVIGTGRIGAQIGQAFAGFGAQVVGYSQSGRTRPGFDVVRKLDAFSGDQSPDILVLALPATAETRGLIDETILSALDAALLINVGRGSTLDHAALKAALDAGSVRSAVLDVFEEEPLPASDWRWHHPRVTITPHVSGLTLPEDGAERFCELLRAYIDKGEKPEAVDIERGY